MPEYGLWWQSQAQIASVATSAETATLAQETTKDLVNESSRNQQRSVTDPPLLSDRTEVQQQHNKCFGGFLFSEAELLENEKSVRSFPAYYFSETPSSLGRPRLRVKDVRATKNAALRATWLNFLGQGVRPDICPDVRGKNSCLGCFLLPELPHPDGFSNCIGHLESSIHKNPSQFAQKAETPEL